VLLQRHLVSVGACISGGMEPCYANGEDTEGRVRSFAIYGSMMCIQFETVYLSNNLNWDLH